MSDSRPSWWGRLWAWCRRLNERQPRATAVAAGVLLIGLPTFFTMFSPARLDRWARALIFIVWLAVAIGSVIASIRHEEKVEQLTEKQRAMIARQRQLAKARLLRALLADGDSGIPPHYEFTVYVFDAESDRLVPIHPPLDPPEEVDFRVFTPGCGATGTAWEEDRLVVVTGAKVSNDAYGLTEEQRRRFRKFRSVAAAPMTDGGRSRVGVLTALSTLDDGHFEGAGRNSLQTLADVMGVMLVALESSSDL